MQEKVEEEGMKKQIVYKPIIGMYEYEINYKTHGQFDRIEQAGTDWTELVKGVLEPGPQLQWSTSFRDEDNVALKGKVSSTGGMDPTYNKY